MFKRILSLIIVLLFVMSSAVLDVLAFNQKNSQNGCNTDITAVKTDPDNVVKDGIIGNKEYHELDIERNAKKTDLSLLSNSSEGRANSEKGLQNVHFYFSWDEVHGLNFALKYRQPTPLNQILTNDMFYGKEPLPENNMCVLDGGRLHDEYVFMQGMVLQIFRYNYIDDVKFEDSGEYNYKTVYDAYKNLYYVGLSKATQSDGSEEKSSDGNTYYGALDECGYRLVPKENASEYVSDPSNIIEDDYDGENALVIADYDHGNLLGTENYFVSYNFEENTVTYEISIPFEYILRPDEITPEGYPKEGTELALCASVMAGGNEKFQNDSENPYFISLGDICRHGMSVIGVKSMMSKGGKPRNPSLTFEIPKCAHQNTYTVKGIVPTCTEDGISDCVKCSDCGYVLKKSEILPASGHEYVHHEGKEPTCTEDGFLPYDTCLKCDYTTYVKEDAKGHKIIHHEGKEPTCSESGFMPFDTCEICSFSTYKEMPVLEHVFSEEFTVDAEPTYEKYGEKSRHCINCGERTDITVISKLDKPVSVNPFYDVYESDYFYDAVMWASDLKITEGISSTRFAPGNYCTRAQIVTFLWRAAGEPAPVSDINPFSDVRKNDYFYSAVLWAAGNNITNGVTDTSFAPDKVCTRAQAVTFLWRSKGCPESVSDISAFGDVHSNEYYCPAVAWAVEKGITLGTSSYSFSPYEKCTRAQIVTFLFRSSR